MAIVLDRGKASPWKLRTPPGTSDYTMHVEEKDGRTILVCTVGTTILHYDARCVADLHAMLRAAGDWVELGSADEQKPAKAGTVEAFTGQPDRRVVRAQEGLPRPLRHVSAAAARSARPLRARAPTA